jgi:hypothetical protein
MPAVEMIGWEWMTVVKQNIQEVWKNENFSSRKLGG